MKSAYKVALSSSLASSIGTSDGHNIKCFQEFVNLLWHLKFVQHMGDDVLELTITIAWSIWFNRNATRLGKSSQNTSMIIQKARALLDEFQVANFQLSQPVVKHSGHWICPKPPWYKINTNATVFEQQQATGVGAVIQDHEGQVVATLSKKL